MPIKNDFIDIEKALLIVDALQNNFPAPLLKLTGGELFLFRNATGLIEELSRRYVYVQVLTNGTLLKTQTIERIARYQNVGFNYSLDGHTLAMNSHRWQSERVNRHVRSMLETILETIGEVELTSVITDRNAYYYKEFLDYLSTFRGKTISIPIPVRGITSHAYFGEEARQVFGKSLPRIAKSHLTLTGPYAYYVQLAKFLTKCRGFRENRCYLPKLAIQIFDTGAVTPCPVGWTVSLGNIYDDGVQAVMGQIGKHKMYDLMTRPHSRVPICRSCFSQADIINLFIEGIINVDEIRDLPMFSREPIRKRLLEMRESIQGNCATPP
jgi:MoaA/NifB/PqqE/SkfB family radical SAM enzyme